MSHHSLLLVCQRVARTCALEVPTNLIGSTNETARLLLAHAEEEAEALARKHNWTALMRERTFTTVAGQADYNLPADYARLDQHTVWSKADYERIRGNLSPGEWQELKNRQVNPGLQDRFRIRFTGGSRKFSIDPTPTAAQEVVYEYVSNQWSESPEGVLQTGWNTDNDNFVLDAHLLRLGIKVRVLAGRGLAFEFERREYEEELEAAIARDRANPTSSIVIQSSEPFIESMTIRGQLG